MFSCKSSQIYHFSIFISITLVQGIIFIFLGYSRSLLTGPPISTLPPSSLFFTLCISYHILIMSFSSLKMLQVLHIDLNSLASPASVSDPCCHHAHPLPSSPLALSSFTLALSQSVALVMFPPAIGFCMCGFSAYNTLMFLPTEFLLISHITAQLSLPWPQ